MKISIITVVFNGEKFLANCIQSVINQSYTNIEYIVIDGASTDSTTIIIEKYRSKIHHFISEPDKGLYDALNKGLNLATGDVVGILNADDVFADNDVIEKVANTFAQNPDVEGVYGDLNYLNADNGKIVRKWISKCSTYNDLANGWMPAHPTLYLKKNLFNKYGNYSLQFGSAADYELMLRFLYLQQIQTVYLHILMVNMRLGGVSNKSLKAIILAFYYDYKALINNKIPNPLLAVLKKKLMKISQF
jgi:glycosyltransferase involved in cell wall biosynthesis